MLEINRQTAIYCAFASFVTGLIIWMNFRPLGLFFISNLMIMLCRKYAHLKIQTSPMIEQKIETLFRNLLDLRESKPGFFCGLASACLVLLAIIGHVISGTYIVILLLVLAVFVSNKYEIKIIADRDEGSCSSYTAAIEHENDEFLPEMCDANITLLKSIGEEADVSAVYKLDIFSEKKDDEDDDDTYSDLLMPQNSITEVDEDQSSESSSDDLISNEIKFKSGHFNANTSSDSDDSISKGLNFNIDYVDSRQRSKLQQNHESQLAQQQQISNLATNFVLNYIKQSIGVPVTSPTVPALQNAAQRDRNSSSFIESSEDDSDFEMLNSDELNNS